MNSLPRTNAYNIQVVQLAYMASVLPVCKLHVTQQSFKPGLGITCLELCEMPLVVLGFAMKNVA